MSHEWVGIVAMLTVFGSPVTALYLRYRHKEKMKLLETQTDARHVAMLEAARLDLESRVRTLETIVTTGDRELEDLKRASRMTDAQRPLLR
jgi:hypothetical protein